MSLLDIPYYDVPEKIDDLDAPADAIAESMSHVARTNRLFGGTASVIRGVAELLRNTPAGTTVRILDIATGSGDIPRALAAWGRRRGLRLEIVAVDNHPAILRLAKQGADAPHLVLADALALPFAPGSFDIALCALAFHHIGRDASVRLLRVMDALTTRGFVVSDLRRDRLSLAIVQTGLLLSGADSFTLHDGPASVRRAWSIPEYRRMVAESGVQGILMNMPWYFRVALLQDKRRSGKHGPHASTPL